MFSTGLKIKEVEPLIKPEFEVLHIGEDVITTSTDCPSHCGGECGVHTCNAECAGFCKPECGVVYDT